ncbi:MAG: SMP-30/gluconolactonase/LRE family protein [Chitinophagaceae bacterium]|nr:SMP-30/gluconolactonase/LRE family protein [Chitinophagaceae bacterium]
MINDHLLAVGEGPVWEPFTRKLYWTDSGGTCMYQYDPKTGKSVVFPAGNHVACCTLHANGGLMLGGRNGFYRLSFKGEIQLAEPRSNEPVPTLVNDIIADPLGRVFGGQECFTEQQIYEPGVLYRIDTNGSISIVEEGLHISNGMGFSPDLRTFYLVDTIPRKVYAYDYNISTGNISNRRILISLTQDDGLPDGMTVDSEGFLWIAKWFDSSISRFDPDGKLERTLALPVAQPTSLCFGGADFNEIFITTASLNWVTPAAPGLHNYSTPRGGGLYRIRQDIIGKPEFQARV